MTMRLTRLAITAAAALLGVGAAAAAAAPAPSPRGNWMATVAVSPSGSHLLGNPRATIKVVEYISYTCPHCAHFQREAETPMQLLFVQPGKVQVEIRHFIRDPIDMTAALLANCGAPARFYLNHSLLLRNQDAWLGRAGKASAAQQARWTSGSNAARFRAIASDLGLYALMAPRGYDRATLDRCLADEAMARRIAGQTKAAQDLGLHGTPGFMLNGLLLAGTYDWPSLRSQIEARL